MVGHLGLTPQSTCIRMGGYRGARRRRWKLLRRSRRDAKALEEAGAGLLVLEGIPREVAAGDNGGADDS